MKSGFCYANGHLGRSLLIYGSPQIIKVIDSRTSDLSDDSVYLLDRYLYARLIEHQLIYRIPFREWAS